MAKSIVAGTMNRSIYGMIILNHRSKQRNPSEQMSHANAFGFLSPVKLIGQSQESIINQHIHCGLIPSYWRFISQCWFKPSASASFGGLKIPISMASPGVTRLRWLPPWAKLSQVAWKEKDEHQPKLQRLSSWEALCLRSSTWIDKLWEVFRG